MTSDSSPTKPPIAEIAAEIAPFHVMKILGEAKALESQGKEVIHLEIGEPDFPSLDCINQAAAEAMKQGLTHYTPTKGLPQLRTKLAQFYKNFYQAEVDANNIMLTPGSSSALQLVLTAILNPKDKVMLADPTYPCNRQFVKLLHADVLSVPVTDKTKYQLNLDSIQKHWQDDIKAVMIASPANPTGTIVEQAELIKIAAFLQDKNAYLIVDEIYQGLVYQRAAESILQALPQQNNLIVINSFSKFFGMTGWRLGWCVAPVHLIPVLDKLGQNLFLAAPTPAQYAALRVLDEDALAELEKRRQIFEQRRNHLLEAMQAAGFSIKVIPQGAFYLYWDISEFTDNSSEFCANLLQQTGVAITPGLDFGHFRSQTHVRIAYTCDEALLVKAVQKIKRFVQQHYQTN